MIIDEDDYMNFIEHHGVKGQKWGVRNISEKLGTDVQKLLHDHPNPPLSPGQKKILDANNKKWKAKFEGPKGWTPGEKHAAEVAAGVAFVGALTLATRGKDLSLLKKSAGFSAEDYMKVVNSADTPDWIAPLRGKAMSATDFGGLVDHTKGRLWTGTNFVTKESFKQEPITFPKGHQFYRISHVPEKTFNTGKTYMLSNEDDLARYRSSYEFGGDGYQIGFKATGDVKVPDLHTNLEAMRVAMIRTGHGKVTPNDVINEYASQSGGTWSDSTATSFIGELKKQGYHAIIDDMDAGIYGEQPLVLFDSGVVGPKTSTKITKAPANAMVKELTNRR